MLQDFSIRIGTKFVFGHRTECMVGTELAQMGVTKVLIHHDDGSYLETTGLLDRVRSSLKAAGISFIELGGVQPNPRLRLVRKGIELCQEEGVNGIVAIGGGSVIDSAKAIGLGIANDCDVWDLFEGKKSPKETAPVAAIITCPASGSESSQVVVINNDEEQRKLLVSDPVVRPALAIMNPELSLSLPKTPTTCGIVDMFSHVCERYFNASTDFGVTDALAEGVLRTIVDKAGALLENPSDYGLRSEFMWIATIAQNNSLGMGRDQDWAVHAIANEMTAIYDTPHGKTLSIVTVPWMRYVYKHNVSRFARYARMVFSIQADSDLEAAKKGIEATERFFASLDMPISFADEGMPEDGIDKMLDTIEFFGDDCAIGAVTRLNRDDCRRILQMAIDSPGKKKFA